MEFLAFLGVLLIIGCPIVLLVLQFSILGRQREMMDLLTGLMGDVRRVLREGRRDRGEAGEPMRGLEAPVLARPPLWWSIPSVQARPRTGGVASGENPHWRRLLPPRSRAPNPLSERFLLVSPCSAPRSFRR